MERFNVTNTPSNMMLDRNVIGSNPKNFGAKIGLIAVLLAVFAAIIYWFWSMFKSSEAHKKAKADQDQANQRMLNIINSNDMINNYVQQKLNDGKNPDKPNTL